MLRNRLVRKLFIDFDRNNILDYYLALSICHRLVQMCWSALLGALTPMLAKNHSIDADIASSNSILSNTINEKLIETHELVFQGLKLVFQLAITVGKLNHIHILLLN